MKRVEQVTNERQKILLGVRNLRLDPNYLNGFDDDELKQRIVADIKRRGAQQERRIRESFFNQIREEGK